MEKGKYHFTRYHDITEEEKAHLIMVYRKNLPFSTDPGHAAGWAAAKTWGYDGKVARKSDSDKFAAALTILVMEGEIGLADCNVEKFTEPRYYKAIRSLSKEG